MQKTLLFLLFSLAALTSTSAQNWIQANSNDILIVEDGQPANIYPSTLSFSGQQAYTTGVMVMFPRITGYGDVSGLDLLLESPAGTKMILQSDLSTAGPFFEMNNVIYTSEATYIPQYFTSGILLHPANAGSPTDTFPAPGPGPITQPNPTFASFLNENPNGQWKLWVTDDSPDGSYFLFEGRWLMQILTSTIPVCPFPEPPAAQNITETTAQITWTGNGTASTWDIFIGTGFEVADEFSVPTISGWPNDTLALTDLTPDTGYNISVRSVCDDGSHSQWIPVSFYTPFIPCNHAVPVSECQEINCDTIPRHPSYFYVESNCGTGTPEWFFAFTPAQSGPYFINLFEYGTRTFWRPDTSAVCQAEGWKCLDPGFDFLDPILFDTLTAGQTYLIMMQNTNNNPHFSISQCPFPRVQASPVFSSTDSLSFLISYLPDGFEADSIEVYVAQVSSPAPDSGTPPTPGAYLVDSTFTVSAGGLLPGTAYDFYIRKRCDDTRTSCWQGPFQAETQPLCSQAVFLGVDTVTYSWADIAFTWEKYLPGSDDWTLRLVLQGQDPEAGTAGDFNISANSADTIRYRLRNIPSYQPLQIYLKAHCAGLSPESQPWQGPFDLPAGTTPPVPIQDIYCMEEQDTYPAESDFNGFLYSQNACYPFYVSMGERIFRYRANQDGQVRIKWNGGLGGNTGAGTGFFVKTATTVPRNQGWTYLGCWKTAYGFDAAKYELPPFEVQKDSAYYILCDGFDGTAPHVPGSFPFFIDGCEVTCPAVDGITLVESTTTTATLSWNNAAPGGSYKLTYMPAAGGSATGAETLVTSDTFAVLNGLLPSTEYQFSIRTFCSPSDAGHVRDTVFQLGENLVVRESVFTRCNPRFVPPGKSAPVNFESFKIQPAETGDYLLASFNYDTYIYKNAFDPEDPDANLVAAVTGYGPGGRKDTLLSLDADEVYWWVVSGLATGFSTGGYNNLKIMADGPVVLPLSPAGWQGREPAAHGSLPMSVASVSGVCQDTSGWVHFYQLADDLSDLNDDKLLLSLRGYPHSMEPASLPLVIGAYGGVSKVTSPPASFVLNPSAWYEMNRFWVMQDLTPEQQTDAIMTIRSYYTEQDFQDLKTAIESEGGSLPNHEAMYFHKINGFHDFSNIDPEYGHPGIPAASAWDQMGYWEYANGPEAGPDTWRHGTYGSDHYAEMTIRGFSGGGGGGSVNGRGALDATVKTTDRENIAGPAIWPNPTSGAFSIELPQSAQPGLTIRITDLTGRTVREAAAQPGSFITGMDLGSLPDGLYFVQILAEGRLVGVSRVIKQE